ncbi:hypothetical protein B0T20DRAFT_122691 [Sordaria brevicollis]|uniref:Uncharacterized protein n=1 Tax=Sordaria brevicollis TaxID=83679 RepID=A0AAE0PKM5_SORBR|nr:hypothetical protein B0T20DRAFT_122691 [Sordaria brevicollis]
MRPRNGKLCGLWITVATASTAKYLTPLATGIRGGCGAYLACTFGRGLLRWLAPPRCSTSWDQLAVLQGGHLRASTCPSPVTHSHLTIQLHIRSEAGYLHSSGLSDTTELAAYAPHNHYTLLLRMTTSPRRHWRIQRLSQKGDVIDAWAPPLLPQDGLNITVSSQ